MPSLAVPVFILGALASIASSTDFCDPKVCTVPPNPVYKNIGCGATGKLSPSCPSEAKYIKFTDEHKKLILDEHNKLRNNIAGGGENGFNTASRMSTLKWNDEFEFLASANVQRCVYGHDKCRNIDGIKFAGQNIFSSSASDKFPDVKETLKQTIQSWYSEVANATQSDIDKWGSSQYKIGHFAQIVSDLNDKIGCGYSQYKKSGWYTVQVTCDYARTNLGTQSVYKSGAPTSDCKTGNNPNYPNLCSENEMPDPNTFIF